MEGFRLIIGTAVASSMTAGPGPSPGMCSDA